MSFQHVVNLSVNQVIEDMSLYTHGCKFCFDRCTEAADCIVRVGFVLCFLVPPNLLTLIFNVLIGDINVIHQLNTLD